MWLKKLIIRMILSIDSFTKKIFKDLIDKIKISYNINYDINYPFRF